MSNPIEEGNSKPIEVIEYNRNNTRNVPPNYYLQAESIFWDKTETGRILSLFSRQLDRAYIPELAQVPEFYPLETHIAFNGIQIITAITELQLRWILTAARGEIKDKRILDLGCGSTGNTWEARDDFYLYQPWLCRALFELGAYPIGVDTGELQGEKFETHKANLLLPDALKGIPDDSIDIIHSRALFTSPELRIMVDSLPVPKWDQERDNYLMQILRPQIERVLKPNGVFVYSKDL